MKWFSSALGAALVALQLAPATGAIAGFVIKAGTAIRQPLQDARLELSGAVTARVTRTDGSGQFVFDNLPAGEYRLAVTRDGFIRQKSAKKIVLGRYQQRDLVFELDAAPTAAGWVLDSYGEPTANIMVEALRRTYDVRGSPRLTRAATALTDDRGQYRIFWLDPGDYYFYASSPLPEGKDAPPLRVAEPTYYPGVSTPEDAKSLRLDIGREIRVDFRIRSTALWAMAGQTMSAVTLRSIAASVTLAAPQSDPATSEFRTTSLGPGASAGEFLFKGVPPGSYLLTATSGSGDQMISAFERIFLRASLGDGPPYQVTLLLYPKISLNGRLFMQGREAPNMRDARIGLISVDPDMASPRSVMARPDGQFILNGVAPGSYVVDMTNVPGDEYILAARYGETDILEKTLTLDPRKPLNPLQILLASDGGRIQATVYDDKGEVFPDAQLVLVPDVKRRNRRDQYRIATSGDDGQVTFRGIPPGSYTLFAWQEVEPNGYLNADYLRDYESLGVPVNIASGDNAPISARLIRSSGR